MIESPTIACSASIWSMCMCSARRPARSKSISASTAERQGALPMTSESCDALIPTSLVMNFTHFCASQ